MSQILKIEAQQTHINYLIDDGTGHMYVKWYTSNDDDAGASGQKMCTENQYVRIIGNIKVIGGQTVVASYQHPGEKV